MNEGRKCSRVNLSEAVRNDDRKATTSLDAFFTVFEELPIPRSPNKKAQGSSWKGDVGVSFGSRDDRVGKGLFVGRRTAVRMQGV